MLLVLLVLARILPVEQSHGCKAGDSDQADTADTVARSVQPTKVARRSKDRGACNETHAVHPLVHVMPKTPTPEGRGAE